MSTTSCGPTWRHSHEPRFYSITVDRHYQHPLVEALLARDEDDVLAMGDGPEHG